jgi:hypothetical protein
VQGLEAVSTSLTWYLSCHSLVCDWGRLTSFTNVPQLEAHNVDKMSEEFTSGGNGGVKMALRVDTDKLERLAFDLKDASSGQIELQEQT